MKNFQIIWYGLGGELDRTEVSGDEFNGDVTKAFIEMLRGNNVTAGDSFKVVEVDENGEVTL